MQICLLSPLVVVAAMSCAGCGDAAKEVKALHTEVAQLKMEVRELRQQLERRHAPRSRQMQDGTNGVRRVRDVGGNGVSSEEYMTRRPKTKEDFEARRKAMQDPEFRNKFKAERKQRMEERRRMHEERRREVKARHESTKPKPPAPLLTKQSDFKPTINKTD